MASHRIAAGHSGVAKSLHEEPAGTDVVPVGSFAKVSLSGSPLCVGQFTRCCGRTSRRWICCRLFALGLPRPSVCLDAILATGLAFDCLVWAVLADADFLAALTVLGGAYPPQFPLFLFIESGPSWLCGWPALGRGRSGFASRVGGFAFLGRVLSKLAGLAKTKVDSKVPPIARVCGENDGRLCRAGCFRWSFAAQLAELVFQLPYSGLCVFQRRDVFAGVGVIPAQLAFSPAQVEA